MTITIIISLLGGITESILQISAILVLTIILVLVFV